MYDFVVVGAGPAGSRFARRAAESGADVIVFERGEIGTPLACSGHLSLDIWEYLPEGSEERLRQNEIVGARFHLGGADSRPYRFYKREPISNALDRVQLDKILASLAREAGADIRTHHRVTEVSEHDDHVRVTVANDEGTEEIAARMVAGCDGPVSKVRSALGLPEPTERLHGVLGFDGTPDHGDFVDVHLTVPRFFAWRIPRGDAGVEYGLAAPPGRDVRDLFDALIDDYGAEIEEVCSGAIPIGPPDTVTSERGFLIGDAAGQTKPFTGGGILYGMTAADAAASTIDPTNPDTLSAYERTWRAELGREIRLGHWLRSAYSMPEPVQRLGLWMTAGEIGVHMDRPSTLLSWDHVRAALSRSQPDVDTDS